MKLTLKGCFILWFVAVCMMLSACSSDAPQQEILVTLKPQKFIVKVPIVGELEATKATNINIPSSVFEPQMIEWLVEENTMVKKGEVVARFDATKYKHQSQQENFQIKKSNIGYRSKQEQLTNESSEISTEQVLIDEELGIAKRYRPEDLSIFSRNDIIDALKNQDYLLAKRLYTDWRSESHTLKSDSELSLLQLQKGQHSAKLNMYESALAQLEVLAPHDGLFVLKKNWRGEKPRVGQVSWPGQLIATLPDLTQLQAKAFILESEAAGLKTGLPVTMVLDAYPKQKFQGKISRLDSIAKARNNQNPVKYFEASIDISGDIKSHWRPGAQLRGEIIVNQKQLVLTLPLQSVQQANGKAVVRVVSNGRIHEREVTLGLRSASRVEITSGLEAGEQIALVYAGRENNAAN